MIVCKKVVGAGVVGVLAATGAGVGASQCNGPQTPTPPALTVPASIASDCSMDVGAALSLWLDGLPANSTVSMGGCYLINSTLHVNGTTNLAITGGTFRQTAAPQPINPMVFLTQNTGLTWTGLSLTGAYNGTNGGAGNEKDTGLLLEANHGVSITHSSVTNIQGDFVSLSPPTDIPTADLNTGITFDTDAFTNAGYHGLTVESVDGLTVTNSTFTGMATDAMDFEVDTYSTTFDATGNPQGLAEDNVAITHNTFANFAHDWFASLQGQEPGVQEQNVKLSNNTLDAASPLVEITGTVPTATNAQYQNRNLTIAFNKNNQPSTGTTGASIADPPGGSAAMTIQGVVNAQISANTFPLFDGTPTYFTNTPYISVLQSFNDPNLVMRSNDFSGAYNITQAGSVALTIGCGNKYGVNGAQLDATCP